MKLIEKIKFICLSALQARHVFDLLSDTHFEKSRLEGEIKRNTHSIEKGLSLEKPRMGFGIAKIKEASRLIERYIQLGGSKDAEPVLMFVSSLRAYLVFHQENDFSNESVKEVKSIYDRLSSIVGSSDPKMGGILQITRPQYTEQEKMTFEKLFNERHSIREFDHTPVDQAKLEHAITLAMRCPSACNRQCQRCYVVDKQKLEKLENLSGIGGFAEDVDKFVLVTGRISDYRKDEYMQWVVTGSVFAAYLTLALQSEGIGACFVQRSLLVPRANSTLYQSIGIQGDEQIICLIAVGNLKEKYTVPQSYRLSIENIIKYV